MVTLTTHEARRGRKYLAHATTVTGAITGNDSSSMPDTFFISFRVCLLLDMLGVKFSSAVSTLKNS
jgi:hypothetical protein